MNTYNNLPRNAYPPPLVATIPLICPHCSESAQHTVYRRIDAHHTHLKTLLLQGAIDVLRCPGCGFNGLVVDGITYRDSGQYYSITIAGRTSPRESDRLRAANQMLSLSVSGARLRLVSNYTSLAEKIRIFDAGWEDLLVECYKYYHTKSEEDSTLAYDTQFTLNTHDHRPILRWRITSPDITCTASITDQLVNRARALADHLRATLPHRFVGWLRLDNTFLRQLMRDTGVKDPFLDDSTDDYSIHPARQPSRPPPGRTSMTSPTTLEACTPTTLRTDPSSETNHYARA